MREKDLTKKLKICEDYLFTDKTMYDISKKYNLAPSSIWRAIQNSELLKKIAELKNVPYKKIEYIKTNKAKRGRPQMDISKKIKICEDYLFTNKRTIEIANEYSIHSGSISNILRDTSVLKHLSKKTKLPLIKLEELRNDKIGKYGKKLPLERKVKACSEYLLSNRTMQDIAGKFGFTSSHMCYLLKNNKVIRAILKDNNISYEQFKKIKIAKSTPSTISRKKINLKTIINACSDYLLTGKSGPDITDKYGISKSTFYDSLGKPKVLSYIAKNKGLDLEDIKKVIDSKLKNKSISYISKLNSCEEYLFSDNSKSRIAKNFGISVSVISNGLKNREVLDEISRKRRIGIEEILGIIKNKEEKRQIDKGNNKPCIRLSSEKKIEICEEYLLSTKTMDDISKQYNIGIGTVFRLTKNTALLKEVAKSKKIPFSKIYILLENKCIKNRRNNKIRTEKSLVDLLDNDEKARRVVERFGGDIGDVADILAVVYEGRLSQEDAAKLVAKPSIRAYLGRFKRPIGGIGELAEISNELLPHDRNEVIQGILYRKVTEYIYQKCGPYPGKEKREGLLKEFEEELSKIGDNGNV